MILLDVLSLGLLAGLTTVTAQGSPLTDPFPDCTNGPLSNNTVCDTSATVADRARALVAALTMDEKFNLTGNTSPGVPRLGLPAYQWWNEALHGVANSPGVHFSTSGNYSVATSFPQPILMGAAFDDALIHAVASVVSTEARAFSNAGRAGLDFWTPNINPWRDPRWGRGMETPGEDTFHLKSYVKALLSGLQGDEDQDMLKLAATCKHFVAYDLENSDGYQRTEFDAIVSQQDLSEYYMQTFQTCARDSQVASVMCSYNAMNGIPTCADPYILQDVLRGHWGWTQDHQYVVSDCDAIQAVYKPHNYASTREQAVTDTLIAGTDLNCGTYYQTWLPPAYSEGLFNQSSIDQTLVRLYSALVKLGYFDGPTALYRNLTSADVNTPPAQALALKAAEEGIVLLKNDGILPWNPASANVVNLAIIGNWANTSNSSLMQGNYYGIAPYTHGLDYGARQAYDNINITINGGVGGAGDPTTDNWPATLALARQADVIIYAAGDTPDEAEEGLDRTAIGWTGETRDLVEQLAGLGKPMMLVAMGDQLDSAPFLANANISAILWGGYPGQDGGTAIFNIISGRVAPAGRLPVTQYPADYVHQVSVTDMGLRPNTTSGNPGRTYRWYDKATLPFGHGLHYTNFTTSMANASATSNMYQISDLVASCNGSKYLDLCPFTSFPIDVANVGNTSSDFVALGFIAGEFGPQPYPIKTLVAYQRLFDITAGSTQTAKLNLTLGSLSRYDDSGNQVLYPGSYSLLIDVPTQSVLNFTLTGQPAVLDQWPVNTRQYRSAGTATNPDTDRKRSTAAPVF